MNTKDGLLYLLQCGANHLPAEKEKVSEMDLDAVYRLSCAHKVDALAASALKIHFSHPDLFNDSQVSKWKSSLHSCERQTILFDAERRQILDYFNQEGIWYMPLKGIILSQYYPRYGLRQMTDNDILFDAAYAEKVRDAMISRGYTLESYGFSNHDEYTKPPFFNFEMHRSLVSDRFGAWKAYYSNVKERLVKVSGSEYRFTDEDFYIFLIVHLAKHLQYAGAGIRNLVDIYLYLGKAELDWNYIAKELDVLELTKEEEVFKSLSFKLFSPKQQNAALNDAEQSLLSLIFDSGAYGTEQQAIQNQLERYKNHNANGNVKKARFIYIKNRLFPEPKIYQTTHPFIFRHKWARAFLPFLIVTKGMTVKREKLKYELSVLTDRK